MFCGPGSEKTVENSFILDPHLKNEKNTQCPCFRWVGQRSKIPEKILFDPATEKCRIRSFILIVLEAGSKKLCGMILDLGSTIKKVRIEAVWFYLFGGLILSNCFQLPYLLSFLFLYIIV